MGEEVTKLESRDYAYDSRSLLKDFDRLLTAAMSVAVNYFNDKTFEQVAQESRTEYKRLIPMLPYVGGKKSPFTNLMIQSGQSIAFYKACKNRGIDTRQIGKLLYEVVEDQIQSVSRIRRWLARLLAFSRFRKQQWKRALEESQKREYPMNWVGEFVKGDEKTFEYGIDFTECGYLKWSREHEGEELAPYLCAIDFARLHGLGIGFRRTQTLARGHPRCDFRLLKNYSTPSGWPPESLDEAKNKPLDNKAP